MLTRNFVSFPKSIQKPKYSHVSHPLTYPPTSCAPTPYTPALFPSPTKGHCSNSLIVFCVMDFPFCRWIPSICKNTLQVLPPFKNTFLTLFPPCLSFYRTLLKLVIYICHVQFGSSCSLINSL